MISITKPSMEIEIFTLKARISALKSRIESEEDFIKRCQAKQRAGLGLIRPSSYDPLARDAQTQHRKKPKRRKKSDVWHNFFTIADGFIDPHFVIKETKEKVEVLKLELEKFKEITDE